MNKNCTTDMCNVTENELCIKSFVSHIAVFYINKKKINSLFSPLWAPFLGDFVIVSTPFDVYPPLPPL